MKSLDMHQYIYKVISALQLEKSLQIRVHVFNVDAQEGEPHHPYPCEPHAGTDQLVLQRLNDLDNAQTVWSLIVTVAI